MGKKCETIQPLITGFIDEELPADQQQDVAGHLEQCATCSELYRQERAVKEAVRENVRMAVTPVHLRQNIRSRISEAAASAPGFLKALQQVFSAYKLKSAFALTLLIIVAGMPYLRTGGLSSPHRAGQGEWIVMEGSAVCIDCELLKQKNHEGHHPHPGAHRTALRTKDGLIWSFLQTEQGIDLINNQNVLNKKIRVRGYRLQDQKYIEVEGFEII